ncbi:hypothetical protein GCM10007079_32170 [Nocardiopsis terrae]|nr:hypothetical protein GCM10007079_32170 [Nocardiopsis terrae]
MGDALAWTGAGLLVGALLWIGAVAVADDGGLPGRDGWWIVSALAALLALTLVLGRRSGGAERYLFWLWPAAGLGLLAAWLAFPGDAFEATARDPRAFEPAPVAVHLWLAACAVALGCGLMLMARRRPGPGPLRRAVPLVCAGALVVALVAVLTARFLVPRVPHHVADGLAEPAPVPAEVSEAGWEWRPPVGTGIEEVHAGSHGPLVLLGDGAVALDGTTGAELWSYRRPHDQVRDVWAQDGRVHVRHRVGEDTGGGEDRFETVVLDAGTGGIVEEGADTEVPSTGWMNEHGRELVADALDLPEDCVVSHTGNYGHRLVGVFGCLEDADAETVRRSVETGNPFRWEGVRTRAVVVAVDPLTEAELWRTELWEAPPPVPEPRLEEAPTGAAGTPVVVRNGPEARTVVLDPGTGEELAALPGDLAASDDLIGVAHADADGTVLAVDSGDLETMFHRVDASGRIIGTAVVEEAFLVHTVGSSRIAVLDDALVIVRKTDAEGVATAVVVRPLRGDHPVGGRDRAPGRVPGRRRCGGGSGGGRPRHGGRAVPAAARPVPLTSRGEGPARARHRDAATRRSTVGGGRAGPAGESWPGSSAPANTVGFHLLAGPETASAQRPGRSAVW